MLQYIVSAIFLNSVEGVGVYKFLKNDDDICMYKSRDVDAMDASKNKCYHYIECSKKEELI